MSDFRCFQDYGCDVINLMATDTDGTVQYFVRKLCTDMDGKILPFDYDLMGEVITPKGVVTPVFDKNKNMTVSTRVMWDLNPTGMDVSGDGKKCATSFLRNYVYDGAGEFVDKYDRKMDGETKYVPALEVECSSGVIPSVVKLEWPYDRYEVDELPGVTDIHNFLVKVRNPKTNLVSRFKVWTEAPEPSESVSANCYRVTEPGHTEENPLPRKLRTSALRRTKNGGAEPNTRWLLDPGAGKTKHEFDDQFRREVSAIRLEFWDLDPDEGIWGLSPAPDYIEDEHGNTHTFEWNQESGAIRNIVGSDLFNVYAYYFNVPPIIEHYSYREGANGTCRAVIATAYTYEAGPCCNCCEEEATVLEPGFAQLVKGQSPLVLPPSGYELLSVSVHSLSGTAIVTTPGGTSELPDNTQSSWTANGADQQLASISIKPDDFGNSLINVNWVAKKIV